MQKNEPFSITLKINHRPRCPGCGEPLVVPTTVIRFGLAMCSRPECAIECKTRKIQSISFETRCKRSFSDSRGVRFWTPRDVPPNTPYAFNHAFPLNPGERTTHPNVQLAPNDDDKVWTQKALFSESNKRPISQSETDLA